MTTPCKTATGGKAAQTGEFDTLAFRQALGTFLTGVTVVTSKNAGGEPIGFTANSFTSVSLSPPLVLVCIAKTSGLAAHFSGCEHYAVNILAESQQVLSEAFSRPSADRFANVSWRESPSGTPILVDVAAWLDCTLRETIDAGDHLILLGEVVRFGESSASPLGYLRGNYLHLSLQQSATRALEDPQQATRVGILLEVDGALLLCKDQRGKLALPTAPKLGSADTPNSLMGALADMGAMPQDKYLFAVYEDKQRDAMSIYYRARVTSRSGQTNVLDAARFYAFEHIPYAEMKDSAEITMVRRYIHERAADAFGIYFGDEMDGDVHIHSRSIEEGENR